jgi:hypothetical protein
VLDWDCAGVGPAGIDLGSLRCDAAWCHGIEAAEQGRPDLTGEVMIERRDAFLDAALTRLAAAR